MRSILNVTKVLFLCILAMHIKPAQAAPLFINATTDIAALSIYPTNPVGNGTTNDTASIQAAIDYLANNYGGGTLFFREGVFLIGGVTVKPGVKIMGADREGTIFRSSGPTTMFDLPDGGELHNFTVYGTKDASKSGDNWDVGTDGVGNGGTATALNTIRVGDNINAHVAEDVVISQVTAREARYDCLSVRGSTGLRVLDCDFDRAGRNIVNMIGNDSNFRFVGCNFGSLYGLYHFDLEPNSGSYTVSDGAFIDCYFDGSHAGEMGTASWNPAFIMHGNATSTNGYITFAGCYFNQIKNRVIGNNPGMQYLYNEAVQRFYQEGGATPTLPDALIRGNAFGYPGAPMTTSIVWGVRFTGSTIIEQNTPSSANSTPIYP